jgi:hypothetical protein
LKITLVEQSRRSFLSGDELSGVELSEEEYPPKDDLSEDESSVEELSECRSCVAVAVAGVTQNLCHAHSLPLIVRKLKFWLSAST